jgi:hypothetical protein
LSNDLDEDDDRDDEEAEHARFRIRRAALEAIIAFEGVGDGGGGWW